MRKIIRNLKNSQNRTAFFGKLTFALVFGTLLIYGIFQGISVGAAVVFYDTFTESSSEVMLNTHTPDMGSSWTTVATIGSRGAICLHHPSGMAYAGTFTLYSHPGCSAGTSKGSLYRTTDAISSANYEASITQVNGGTGTTVTILACRIQDANNMYAVEFNESASKLAVKSSGTWSTLDTGAAIADGSVVTLLCDGSTISVEDDGVEVMSAVDSTHTSAGYAGLGVGSVIDSGDGVSDQKFDNFEVNTLVASDTTPPTPDPMTFSSAPTATGTSTISMTATTATDAEGSDPVEYLFTFTACSTNGGTGGTSSAWQTSTTYIDTGLEPGKCYGYSVKARDSEGNETGASSVVEEETEGEEPEPPAAGSLIKRLQGGVRLQGVRLD